MLTSLKKNKEAYFSWRKVLHTTLLTKDKIMKRIWISSENFIDETKILITPINTRSKISYLIEKWSILIILLIFGSGVIGLFYLIENLIAHG